MVSWVKGFGLFGGFLLAHLAPIRGDDELVYVAYINGSDDQEIYINSTDPIDLDSEAGRREAARNSLGGDEGILRCRRRAARVYWPSRLHTLHGRIGGSGRTNPRVLW